MFTFFVIVRNPASRVNGKGNPQAQGRTYHLRLRASKTGLVAVMSIRGGSVTQFAGSIEMNRMRNPDEESWILIRGGG